MSYNIFDKHKYISVEGNIGAGKTSLTKIISEKYQINGLFWFLLYSCMNMNDIR